jgi:dienelactone hydrolase
MLAFGRLGVCAAAVALVCSLASAGGARARPSLYARPGTTPRATLARPSSYAVGLRVIRFVDIRRTFVFRRKHKRERVPRTLLTEVLYPAVGTPSAADVRDAPAASLDGPFPLVVFGHGFDVTPATYARLLHSWAQAGYVVAAPTFPGENPAAPGGPNESDIVNEPGDMSFVITQMLAANAGSGPLSQLIDPSLIAVAGHSDGAEVALAVAYDPRFRDRRVRAAIVLSGAEIEAKGNLKFPIGGPPLLATEGTADKVNLPTYPYHFFKAARPPKYLLRLLGAGHLPPYTRQEPELEIVERVTRAFLDAYLEQTPGALAQLRVDGNVPGYASLQADP